MNMTTKRTLLGVYALFAALILSAAAYAACGDSCVGTCPSAGGISFTGHEVGAPGTAVTNTCRHVRCSGSSSVCAGGPLGTLGCDSDSDCASGQVCATSIGDPGCGTGGAQCMSLCTTTSTSTSTTTTT